MNYFIQDFIEDHIIPILFIILVGLGAYTVIGTNGNVDKIKELVPTNITNHGWKILSYEGYQFGSWSDHGGKVWYHVQEIANPNIRYRVYYTLWNNELQTYYNEPEVLTHIELNNANY